MRQIRREQQNKVAQNNKGMVNNDALFCIYQDKTLRHDVAKSVSCRTGSLKSGRGGTLRHGVAKSISYRIDGGNLTEKLYDTMSQSSEGSVYEFRGN